MRDEELCEKDISDHFLALLCPDKGVSAPPCASLDTTGAQKLVRGECSLVHQAGEHGLDPWGVVIVCLRNRALTKYLSTC
jgi:hypothetical protein